jgi:Zn-dependent protease
MRFSQKELRDLAIAWIVLAVILARLNLALLPMSFIAVGTAFVCHELAHKYYAQRHHLFAEFRMWTNGLILAIAIAVISQGQFIFAAPGAVYIYGYNVSPSVNGKISFAGPAVNLFVATLAMMLYVVFPSYLVAAVALINAFLGFFNLLPIHPLDGGKILNWNRLTYFGALGWSLVLVFLTQYLLV